MPPLVPVLLVAPLGPGRTRLAEILGGLACEVRVAPDREDAEDALGAWTPRLVVVDDGVPGDVLAHVRVLRALAPAAAFLVHAATERAALLDALGDEIDDLLTPRDSDGEIEARLRSRIRTAYAESTPAVSEELRRRTVGLVVHDINNALTAIRILGDMLLADARDPAVKGDLRDVLEAADLAGCTVESLAAQVRHESGDVEPTWFPVRVDAVVRDVVERPCLVRHVALREPLPHVELRGDRQAIGQALTELLLNGRRMSEGRGPMLVSVEEEDGAVTVRVQHPEMRIPHVFRSDLLRPCGAVAAREARVPVAAVGLGAAHLAARMHGGAVRFEDGPDGATALCLTIRRV